MKRALYFTMCAIVTFYLTVDKVSATDSEVDCSKEVLLAYFPEAFVNQVLAKYKVPESKWQAINRELSLQDKEIINLVREKAAQLKPNPLEEPQLRRDAVRLFKDTLLEVFSTVLKKNGVTDDKQIQTMLDDIQQQKAQHFAQCMSANRVPKAENTPSASTSNLESNSEDQMQESDEESLQEEFE